MQDKRTIDKKDTPCNERLYNHSNQGIFKKVETNVKNFLESCHIYDAFQWITTPQEQSSLANTSEEKSVVEDEIPPQKTARKSPLMHRNKRLRIHEPASSILSENNELLSDINSSNKFNQSTCFPFISVKNDLVENKESSLIVNKNNEAFSFGRRCSSTISPCEEKSDLSGCSMKLGNTIVAGSQRSPKSTIDLKKRTDLVYHNEKCPSSSASNRPLWSEIWNQTAKLHQMAPSMPNINQPNIDISALSKANQQMEGKIASAFYPGKTSFDDASQPRRIPLSTAPYQIKRPSKYKIKVHSSKSEDSLAGMSSAAKRIMHSLEKTSSSLTPPKYCWNIVPTSAGVFKGPPIADIRTIFKLKMLKSCEARKQNYAMESSPVPPEGKVKNLADITQSDLLQTSSKSNGGGKIISKIHRIHQPSAGNCLLKISAQQMDSDLNKSSISQENQICIFPSSNENELFPSIQCGLKDRESFKCSSPLQSSPLTFISNFSSLSETTLTSTFTSSNSGSNTFFTPISSNFVSENNTNELKGLSLTEAINPTSLVPGVKFGVPKVPLLGFSEPNILRDDHMNKIQSTDDKLLFFNIPSNKNSNERRASTTVTYSRNFAPIMTPFVMENLNSTTSAENEEMCFVVSGKTDNPGIYSQPLDSKINENMCSTQSRNNPLGGFNFKIPCSIASFDRFNSNCLNTKSELISQSKITNESKLTDPTLSVVVSTQSLHSPFLLPSSVSKGETNEVTAVKNNLMCSNSSSSTSAFSLNCTPVSLSGLTPIASQPSISLSESSTCTFSRIGTFSYQPSLSLATSQSFDDMKKCEDKTNAPSVTSFSSAVITNTSASSGFVPISSQCNLSLTSNQTFGNINKCEDVKTVVPAVSSTSTTSGLGPFSFQPSLSLASNQSLDTVNKCDDVRPLDHKTSFSAVTKNSSLQKKPTATTIQSNPFAGFSFFTSSAENTTPSTTLKASVISNTSTLSGFIPISSQPNLSLSKNQTFDNINQVQVLKNVVSASSFSAVASTNTPKISGLTPISSQSNLPLYFGKSFCKTSRCEDKANMGSVTSFGTTVITSALPGFVPTSSQPIVSMSSNLTFGNINRVQVLENAASTSSFNAAPPTCRPAISGLSSFSQRTLSLSSRQSIQSFDNMKKYKEIPNATSFRAVLTNSSLQEKQTATTIKSNPFAGFSFFTSRATNTSTTTKAAVMTSTSSLSDFIPNSSQPILSSNHTFGNINKAQVIKNFESASSISAAHETCRPAISDLSSFSYQRSLSLSSRQSFQSFENMKKCEGITNVASVTSFRAVIKYSSLQKHQTASTIQSNPFAGFPFYTSSATNTAPTPTPSMFMPGNSATSWTLTSGSNVQSTNSTISGIQTSLATPNFQSGCWPATNLACAPMFGSGASTITNGQTDSINQASNNFHVNSAPFDGTALLGFGRTENSVPSFGMPQSVNVPAFFFPFGVKRQAVAPQYTFGTTTSQADPTPSCPIPQFNLNIPASFNFGATPAPPDVFQFNATNQSPSEPRRIKKAIRRLPHRG